MLFHLFSAHYYENQKPQEIVFILFGEYYIHMCKDLTSHKTQYL